MLEWVKNNKLTGYSMNEMRLELLKVIHSMILLIHSVVLLMLINYVSSILAFAL